LVWVHWQDQRRNVHAQYKRIADTIVQSILPILPADV
jgi:hypothetical protein